MDPEAIPLTLAEAATLEVFPENNIDEQWVVVGIKSDETVFPECFPTEGDE